MYLTAGQVQILGDLAAGLAGTDHEHGSVRQLFRSAVLRRVQLRHVIRKPLRHPGYRRSVVRPGGHHDLFRGQPTPAGFDLEQAGNVAPQPGHLDALGQWRFERGRVLLQVPDDVVTGHEAVRLGSPVREARQLALPVRGHQAERVPTPLPPLVSDPVALQHHVVHAAQAQVVAHRQTGLPGTDHDNRVMAAVQRSPAVTRSHPAHRRAHSGARGIGTTTQVRRSMRTVEA